MSLRNIKTIQLEKYKKLLKNREILFNLHQAIKQESDTEQNIINWLSRLKLLYGVPFEYLVCNENMLPSESIKFFYVDSNWITGLIDGAYSIGRATESDKAHDDVFSHHINLSSTTVSQNIREKVFSQKFSVNFPQNSENDNNNIITGFLLRSVAVSNWPGLEFNGYQTGQINELKILRLDHISPNILLCLFAGEVNSLEIHMPSEVIHFGLDSKSVHDQYYKKTLRNKQGIHTTDFITLDNSFFRDSEINIIKITTLANTMKEKLSIKEFTSAEFGLQMVSGVEMVKLNKKEEFYDR